MNTKTLIRLEVVITALSFICGLKVKRVVEPVLKYYKMKGGVSFRHVCT